MRQIIPINLNAIFSNLPCELIPILLILAYLGLYFLGLYFSCKPKISFFKSVGLTASAIGMIIFTLTGGNLLMGLIVALSHILIGAILRKSSA